ncbi:MAG: DUF6465 family protein [Lachnospiraceae bacterium]|nr:DUF6465 family protein [Lachnospiraceae bacterium]
MAEEKKISVTSPTASEAKVTAKAAPIKKEVAVKKETAPKKPAAKKEAAPKKPAVVKEAAPKKPAAKKPAAPKKPTAKTTSARAVAVKKSEVVKVEFNGKSYTQDDLLKSARDVWQYDIGKKAADLKSIELYVKPEEERAYYVFNNDITGSFAI